MKIFVGIDPSVNSTGVCIVDENYNETFYIVKPNKLTRRESSAQENIPNFNYILYTKTEVKDDVNHHQEYNKTVNIINAAYAVERAIKEYVENKEIDDIYIVQEGISYGSTLRTKSVFDLAGLNYILRERFVNKDDKFHMFICPPSEIKKFATGKGNAKKDIIIDIFKAIHPDFDIPKIDDIADAYFMANYANKLYNDEVSQNC